MGHSQFDEENSIGDKGEKDVYVVETGAVPTETLVQGNSWTAKLQRLAGKLKIEQRGIERVPEDERTDTNGVANVGTMVCPFETLSLDSSDADYTCILSGSQRTWSSVRSQSVPWQRQSSHWASQTLF